MKVLRPVENKNQKLLKIFYISIIAICIISLISAFIIHMIKGNQIITGNIPMLPELTNDKITQYKQDFNNSLCLSSTSR